MIPRPMLMILALACRCGPGDDDTQSAPDETGDTYQSGDTQETGDTPDTDDTHETGDTQPPPPTDLNGDGLPDLILAGYRTSFDSEDYANTTRIHLGTASGFESNPSQELEGFGTRQVLVDDLDRDGHLDLVLVNNRYTDDDFGVSTFVYWGENGSFDQARRSELPCSAAGAGAIADLNQDGYPDLALACIKGRESYVYWGRSDRMNADDHFAFEFTGGRDVLARDLNDDGWVDLAFANERDSEGNYQTNSHVMINGPDGFQRENAVQLPTIGALKVVAGDPDGDGYTDLLFVDYKDGEDYTVDSYLYWGSADGWSVEDRFALATAGAYDAAFTDLNGDGLDDIVIASWFDNERYDIDSPIYWNSADGFGPEQHSGLPTLGTREVRVADLNLDGFPDVLLPSYCTDGKFPPEGRIFWGSAAGPSADVMTMLEPGGVRGVTVTDANLDGLPDIIFAGYNSPCGVSAEESYAYWGSEAGFEDRQVFATPVIQADPVVVGGGSVD
jgi:hypothetical protein